MEEKEIYRKAVDYFGVGDRVKQTIEECGNLIVALSRARRNKETIFGVAAEIIHVEIMCGQLREMVTPGIMEKMKPKELRRLELLIGEK